MESADRTNTARWSSAVRRSWFGQQWLPRWSLRTCCAVPCRARKLCAADKLHGRKINTLSTTPAWVAGPRGPSRRSSPVPARDAGRPRSCRTAFVVGRRHTPATAAATAAAAAAQPKSPIMLSRPAQQLQACFSVGCPPCPSLRPPSCRYVTSLASYIIDGFRTKSCVSLRSPKLMLWFLISSSVLPSSANITTTTTST